MVRMIWLYAYGVVNRGHVDITAQGFKSEWESEVEKSLSLVRSKIRSMCHSHYACAGLQMSQLLLLLIAWLLPLKYV